MINLLKAMYRDMVDAVMTREEFLTKRVAERGEEVEQLKSEVERLRQIARAATAAERERCAKICDQRAATWKASRQGQCSLPLEEECKDIAAAIRRGS